MWESAKMMGFIFTTDYAKAREFYEKRLGLTFVSHDQFALVVQAGANLIRIVEMKDFAPLKGTVLGWQVADIVATVNWLSKRGVAFEKYPFVQDSSGIWTAPGGDRVAWFKDPDGNVLGISQHQPSASN